MFTYAVPAQEIDITPALQKIESGRISEAQTLLKQFKSENASDSSVLFLDAVLTKDGNEAVNKYSIIIDKYPKSKFADASLYRIFSYYYSLGYYKKAEAYLNRMKKDYPDSPYLKSIDKSLPGDDKPEISIKDSASTKLTDSNELKTKSVDSTSYNYTIQAGAFLNIENAKNLCSRLNKENYSTQISTREIGGSTLNVGIVGKFEKEEDAVPLLNYLEKNFNLKGRVVRLNN
jgi:tetratricopeptide (TPR) repeat protein